MANISKAGLDKLVQVQIEALKESFTWSDVETLFAQVSPTEQEDFVNALLQSDKVLIRRKLDDYLRPKAIEQVNTILNADPSASALIQRLVK